MVRVERNMSRSRYSGGSATPSSRSIAARSSGMWPMRARSAAVGGTTPSSRPSTSGVPSGAAIEASRPTGRQDEVGGQQIAVPLGEGAEVRAAHLLLAVEDELDGHPGADAKFAHQLDRSEVCPDRPLVG